MRLAILRRWIAIPLRDRTLLLALVAALSVPAFLVASADHWATAAADGAVSRLVADQSESALGVSVETVATFSSPEPLETADGVVLRVGGPIGKGNGQCDESNRIDPSSGFHANFLVTGPPVPKATPDSPNSYSRKEADLCAVRAVSPLRCPASVPKRADY